MGPTSTNATSHEHVLQSTHADLGITTYIVESTWPAALDPDPVGAATAARLELLAGLVEPSAHEFFVRPPHRLSQQPGAVLRSTRLFSIPICSASRLPADHST